MTPTKKAQKMVRAKTRVCPLTPLELQPKSQEFAKHASAIQAGAVAWGTRSGGGSTTAIKASKAAAAPTRFSSPSGLQRWRVSKQLELRRTDGVT